MRRTISWTDGLKDGRTDEQTYRGKTVYSPPPSGSRGIINVIFSDNVLILYIFPIKTLSKHFSVFAILVN